MSLSLFKSQEAKARYFAVYDSVMEMWPIAYESRQVSTRFGTTHVIACGPSDAPALVLLHGFGANATMWMPMAGFLGQNYRLYALDTIGDLGKSVPSRRLEKAADYVDWLQDVFAGIHLEKVNLVGFSQGAWIALNFAIHCPDALAKLILISPNAGLVPVSARFMIRLITMVVLPIASMVENWARWNSNAWDTKRRYYQLLSQLTRAGLAGQKRGRPGVMPVTFSDAQLQTISCPVLMLVGRQEVVNDPVAALNRARKQVRGLEGEIIEQARHMLPFDQPQTVCERIVTFMRRSHEQRCEKGFGNAD